MGRVNSAIGFFAQVDHDQAGPGVWAVLDQTLTAPGSLDAFYAATGRRHFLKRAGRDKAQRQEHVETKGAHRGESTTLIE